MNERQALSKAQKAFGKKAFIRINKKAPVGEDYQDGMKRRTELTERLKALKEQRDARFRFILSNDLEYQELHAACVSMEKERDACASPIHRRVEILTDEGYAYRIRGQGDNFEDAIAAALKESA